MKFVVVVCVFAFLAFGDAAATSPKRTWEKEDNFALSITNRDAATIAGLVSKIKSFRSDEWGHFRIAFRWVAENVSYDVPASKADKQPDQSAQQILRNRRAVCAGYANLLQSLASGLGIKTEIVSGYSKQRGVCYEKLGRPTHAWNAAQLDGEWYLFDATWAAGSVSKEDKFKKHFEEFYFAPDPAELLFNHFPEDPRWQLVDDEIKLEAFQSGCSVGVELFRMGITAAAIKQNCPDVQCEFVEVSSAGVAVSITKIDIPLGRLLSAGKPYTFAIWAPKSVKFVVENMPVAEKGKTLVLYDNWTTDMKYKNGVSQLTFTPQPGELVITMTEDGNSERIFKWNVSQ